MQESALAADVYELTEQKKLENTLARLACRKIPKILLRVLHGLKCLCIY